MGRLPHITRRDFLGGVALATTAAGTLSPRELLASVATSYPPALTGLRGSHPGSFDVAHAVAREGKRFPTPREQTDADYDLVVIGGGISGLAAAYFYRQRGKPDARILILDNHDDFGGHARRNEFVVDGTRLIGYGGSQSLEAPSRYSDAASGLLRDLAIVPDRFYDYFDRSFRTKHQLGEALYCQREVYGSDRLVPWVFGGNPDASLSGDIGAAVDAYPVSATARAALQRLLTAQTDYLAGRSVAAKIQLLQRTPFTEYLHRYTGTPTEVTELFRDQPRGIWGVGWDALSALEGYRWGYPGTRNLGIEAAMGDTRAVAEEPYIFHFPDGNAGVARALVRSLIPASAPGSTMEDLVLARTDYAQLDCQGSPVRLRLNATVTALQHTADERAVDVVYVRQGNVERVRGRHIIYAGYHAKLPGICPELPDRQREAIAYGTKVPLVYISIALRNWRAFQRLGVAQIYAARPTLMHSFGLDFPVSMGGYRFPASADQPVVVHGTYVPAVPDSGLTAVAQHRRGRARLYEMCFADFEEKIVRQLDGALGAGGFDPERDIAAMTVNRWPHGYSYEYNELFDNPAFGPDFGPHLTARIPVGRISIANSDASAYAYVDGAIDAADRAVKEQVGL